jgi:hypothetical protein
MVHCFSPQEAQQFCVDQHGMGKPSFRPIELFSYSHLLMGIMDGELTHCAFLCKVLIKFVVLELTSSVQVEYANLDLVNSFKLFLELLIFTLGLVFVVDEPYFGPPHCIVGKIDRVPGLAKAFDAGQPPEVCMNTVIEVLRMVLRIVREGFTLGLRFGTGITEGLGIIII